MERVQDDPHDNPATPLPSGLLAMWLFLATQFVAFAVLTGTVLVLRVGQQLASAFQGAPHWGLMTAPVPPLLLAGTAFLLAWGGAPWRRRGALALAFVAGALVTAAPALTLFATFSPMEPPLTTFCRRVAVVFFLAHALVLALMILIAWLRDRAPATPARAWYAGFVAVVWPAVALAAYL